MSLKYGAKNTTDSSSKEKTYERTEKFMNAFEGRNNSTVCRELLGFEIGSNSNGGQNSIISERCPKFVIDAAEILDELLRS
jgi:hypothetical protein